MYIPYPRKAVYDTMREITITTTVLCSLVYRPLSYPLSSLPTITFLYFYILKFMYGQLSDIGAWYKIGPGLLAYVVLDTRA